VHKVAEVAMWVVCLVVVAAGVYAGFHHTDPPAIQQEFSTAVALGAGAVLSLPMLVVTYLVS
jgi:hypothetical protein